MSKTGIALIVVAQAGGNVWPRNVEITDETNVLDVRNRSVMFFPDISDYPTLVDKHLLFRAPIPRQWYSLNDKPDDLKGELVIWKPELPVAEVEEAEVLFHNIGTYKGAYGTYEVVILEPTNIEVMYKNFKTVLGGRTPPELAFESLDIDLAEMLLSAWKRFE